MDQSIQTQTIMKATLNFDLSDSDDQREFDMCVNARKMFLVLWEYDQALRAKYKYEGIEGAEEYRDLLREHLVENGISHLI